MLCLVLVNYVALLQSVLPFVYVPLPLNNF
jgi:hypothetical protein